MDRNTLDQLNNTLINPDGPDGKISAERHREMNDAIADFAQVIGTSRYGGVLMIADVPLTDKPGYWMAGQTGTYTDAGGLVVDITNKLVFLSYDGTTWEKLEILAADGKSAYQLAVDLGFTGTIPEWLASMKAVYPSMSKWDIVVDANGWVHSYVLHPTGHSFHTVGYYDITIDPAGNVSEYFKTWQPEAPEEIETLKNAFSAPSFPAVGTSAYLAFPGIAVGLDGTLHVVYRTGAAHVSINGTILYTYSKDFGKTWGAPVVLLQGGTQTGDWYQDFRDCRIIRMSNGKYLFGTFSLQIKPDPGQPFDVAINPDPTTRKIHSVILEEDVNGVLNVAGKTVVNHPITDRFTAGGLKEHNGVIYQLCYRELTPPLQETFLTRSLNFGVTWEDVAVVSADTSEGSIDFIGETMYALLRPEASTPGSPILKSEDYGVTWELLKYTHTFHGLDLKAVGGNLMVAGRQPMAAANPTVELYDVFGNSLIAPIYFYADADILDLGYSQICFFEQYIYIVYYNVNGARTVIEVREIEKYKLLNI